MITKQYDDQIFSGYAQYSLLVIHAVNAGWQLLNQKCLKPFTLPTRDVIGAPKKAKPVLLADRQICLVENSCVSVVTMLPLVAPFLPFSCYPSTFQLFKASNMFFFTSHCRWTGALLVGRESHPDQQVSQTIRQGATGTTSVTRRHVYRISPSCSGLVW